MRNAIGQKEIQITEEDFFHLGLGRFLVQEPENIQRVVSEKLVDFSTKNQMAVEPRFFLEMTNLGKEIWGEKLHK